MSEFILKDLGSQLNGIIAVKPKDIERCIGMPVCRICYESEPDNLIEPCNCKGSMGKMHKKCLELWLSEKHSKKCEFCSFAYDVEFVPKYKRLQSFFVWTKGEFMQTFTADIIVMVYWTTILIGAFIFAFPKMFPLEKINKTKGLLILIILFVLNFIVIIARMVLLVIKAYKNWTIWKTLQTNISLIVKPDKL